MTLDTIKEALAKGSTHLGTMLWWAMEDVLVKKAVLEATWAQEGLDPEALPDTGGPARALRQAGVRALQGADDHLWRLAADTKTHVIYALLREDKDGNGNVTTTQEAQVMVDGAGSFSTDNPQHPLVLKVKDRYDALWGSYTADDLRAAIMRVLRDCAVVTLRDKGGVYFVPAPYAATVDALARVIAQAGTSRAVTIPLMSDPEGRAAASVASEAKGGMEQELTALKEELAAYAAAVLGNGDGAPRMSTLDRRLREFGALRARASLYRDVLAMEAGDLEAQIAELEDATQNLLTVLDDQRTDDAQATLVG